MTNQLPKIVVITPIKNEGWFLERFLAITSQFADRIIIADQNSTDGSPDICKQYPKVILIKNDSDEFNEAERQLLLIKTARELVPEHKIILALDADEILAANALQTLGWQSMLEAKPGTILYFEKPDLFLTPHRCLRYTTPWPIGYVDIVYLPSIAWKKLVVEMIKQRIKFSKMWLTRLLTREPTLASKIEAILSAIAI